MGTLTRYGLCKVMHVRPLWRQGEANAYGAILIIRCKFTLESAFAHCLPSIFVTYEWSLKTPTNEFTFAVCCSFVTPNILRDPFFFLALISVIQYFEDIFVYFIGGLLLLCFCRVCGFGGQFFT